VRQTPNACAYVGNISPPRNPNHTHKFQNSTGMNYNSNMQPVQARYI